MLAKRSRATGGRWFAPGILLLHQPLGPWLLRVMTFVRWLGAVRDWPADGEQERLKIAGNWRFLPRPTGPVQNSSEHSRS